MSVPRASSPKPRKSPLRVAALPAGISAPLPRPASVSGASLSGEQLRAMMISEFCQWLRSRTNQEKRPFQEETITAYKTAARALDAWMKASAIDGDFTACDASILNRFFREYHAAHGQGGTNTKQRNLRHLFTWLEAQYDHPHPYTDDLNWYAPVKTRPSTLSVFPAEVKCQAAIHGWHCRPEVGNRWMCKRQCRQNWDMRAGAAGG